MPSSDIRLTSELSAIALPRFYCPYGGFQGAPRLDSLPALELPIRGSVKIHANLGNFIRMQLNLSAEEHAALTRHLCEHIRHTAHPFAESYELLKSILIKLDPQSEILLNPEPKRR
jgi:hypothetical protein